MKAIFISGYRWSGSSALTELVMDNFRCATVVGEEILPLNLGFIPRTEHVKWSYTRYFLSGFFLDPLNLYSKRNFFGNLILMALVKCIAFSKPWIRNYVNCLSEMLRDGYHENLHYRDFVLSVYSTSYNIDAEHFSLMVSDFLMLLKFDENMDVLIVNNAIPAESHLLLQAISQQENIMVMRVKRDIRDQSKDIRNNSLLGKIYSLSRIQWDLSQVYDGAHPSNAGNLLISFEGLVLNSAYRNEIIAGIANFLGIDLHEINSRAISKSSQNISQAVKDTYLNKLHGD